MKFAKKKKNIYTSEGARKAASSVQHFLNLAKAKGSPHADGNHVVINWWGVTLITWFFDEGAARIEGRSERVPCETAEEAAKLFISQMEIGK